MKHLTKSITLLTVVCSLFLANCTGKAVTSDNNTEQDLIAFGNVPLIKCAFDGYLKALDGSSPTLQKNLTIADTLGKLINPKEELFDRFGKKVYPDLYTIDKTGKIIAPILGTKDPKGVIISKPLRIYDGVGNITKPDPRATTMDIIVVKEL